MFDGKGQAYIANGAFQWEDGTWRFRTELPSDPEGYSAYLKSIRN